MIDLIGLLADGDRLRVFAAIVLGHETVADLRRVTGLGAREVGTALSKLVRSGLVAQDALGYHLQEHELRLAARATRPAEPEAPDANPVVRAFMREGRLLSIPATHRKRQVVLDILAQDFEPGRRYTEKEVNLILGKRFADTAALRRYLVDDGYLERDVGGRRYWRAGGTFHIEQEGDPRPEKGAG